MRDDQSGHPGVGGWPQVQPGEPSVAPDAEQPLVEPDGYVYDAYGYAHPVYGGYVYDEQGNAYPVESLVTQTTGEMPPVAASPSDPYTYDRFAPVDPTRWGFHEVEGAAEVASRSELRGRRRRRTGITLAVCLALFLGVGWYVYTEVLPSFRDSGVTLAADDYPGPGTGSVEVVINQGDAGQTIARTLLEAGVVKSTEAFVRAYAANPDATSIQHGTYKLLKEMKAADAVEWLLDRNNRIELRVTIPEGFTVAQILKVASSKTQIPLEDFEKAAENPRDLGVPKGVKHLEGWLFPATYTVEPGDTAEDVLSAMVAKTRRELEKLDVPEDEWETVLIKASLVEREMKHDEDRGKAARAIENRLAADMRLEIDATVAYGLGKSGLELTSEDLRSDNPYNTRRFKGLPPSPIGSPGLASIKAVLDPPEGPWLFWVTVNLDTGETLFAETYEEHLKNEELLRQWLAENPVSSDEG